MKKLTKILAVCMLLVIVAMSFASCGLIGMDLEKMADRLEDKDYVAVCVDMADVKEIADDLSPEETFAVLHICLLFGMGFGVDLDETEPVAFLLASTEDEETSFMAIEFGSTKDAKSVYEDVKDNRDAFLDLKDEESEDLIYGKIGKIVYVGTEQGLKDALGFPANLLVYVNQFGF